MILTVDIGNTNIVLGCFDGDEPSFVARVSTDANKTDSEYAVLIRNILFLHSVDKSEINGAIISSVVPPLTSVLRSAVMMSCGVKALNVGPGIKTGLNLLADNPSQVGADLICACVAAYNLYTPPAVIIDMGTATKILLVNEKAQFTGASIIPGAELSLKALAGGTAQLPQIGLDAPKNVMGKNTVECMQSGIVYGNASMIDGMIERTKEEIGCSPTLIATGGLSRAIIPHCKHNIIIDDNLILKGLLIIYNKNRKK